VNFGPASHTATPNVAWLAEMTHHEGCLYMAANDSHDLQMML